MDFTGFYNQLSNLSLMLMVLTAIVHLFCAIGVARDSNNFTRQQIPTQIVSASIWVLATLVGGMLVLALYWFMHHSTLARR